MARYNEILVGRYNRFLQKLFSMKGGPPSPQLASEIAPAFPMFNGAENRYLEGWDRFGFANIIVAGGAGNNSQVRLRNPVGSNIIAVIERITFANPLAQNPSFELRVLSTDLTSALVIPNSRLDARGRTGTALTGSFQNNAAVSFTLSLWNGNGAAGSTLDAIVDENQEFPILPGDALTVKEGTLNQAVGVAIWWRERLLEESERS
jgi:hypothetical protein